MRHVRYLGALASRTDTVPFREDQTNKEEVIEM